MPTTGVTIESSSPSAGKRLFALLQKTWLRVAILLTAAIVIHLPSLQGQLIWDDNYLVRENPFFRSPIFSWEIFRHYLFLDSLSTHYRPVQNLSYMVDYLLWNGELYGYHLSNVLWHAGASILLYLLLKRLLPGLANTERGQRYGATVAVLVALLWVVHPVHSAAVDYISGRADSLAFVFSCGAWLMYLRARGFRHPALRSFGYMAAAGLVLLGMCAREIACIWAALFLIHLLFFTRDLSRTHRAVAVAACLLMVAAYAGLRTLPAPRPAQTPKVGWSTVARTGLMLKALGDYARLTVLPTGLHMERGVDERRMYQANAGWRDQFAFNHLTVLGLITSVGLLFGAMKRGEGRKLRRFGALWFVVGFLPVSNLIQLNATSAEHWLYLPLVGLLLFAVGWLLELQRNTYRVAVACGVFAAVALSARSAVRSSDWLNEQVFYERTMAAAGWSPRLGLNLAIVYKRDGRFVEACQLLERTLAAWPDYSLAKSHLASTLIAMGKMEQGDRLLVETAAVPAKNDPSPRNWVASFQLALKNFEDKRWDAAFVVLVEAQKLNPEAWPLVRLQSEILRQQQGPKVAIPLVEKFAKDNWWDYRAYLALGKLKAQNNDVPGALAALKHACRLDIRETEALNFMTRLELMSKNLPAALLTQERAVSRQPDEPSQYLLYSEVLRQMGRTEQAEQALETAKRLKARASA